MDMDLQQEEHIQLWEYATVRIIRVQKQAVEAGAQGITLAFRTSGFFCVSSGSALMLFHGRVHSLRGMQIFHVPPGNAIELNAGSDGLDYCLLLYDAALPAAAPAALHEYREACDPFLASYFLAPAQPGVLYALMEQMLELWQQPQPIARLRLKAAAYQWISHVIEQYHDQRQPVKALSPVELVTAAMEYMLEHHASSLTLESLAAALHVSPGHLSNRFKQVLDRGPIDCLIRLRMEKARRLLADTQLPLRLIAAAVGYQDAYYFSNAFKKYAGRSPTMYRKQRTGPGMQEDITLSAGRSRIVAPNPQRYNENDNYYQYADGGSEEMLKMKKMVPASLLLAFGLLAGACGSGNSADPASNAGAGTQNQSPAAVQDNAGNNGGGNAKPEETAVPATRTVSTANGDVEVPAEPQRVVTDFYLGYLLALDVKPVGTNKMFMQNPYLADQVDGIVDVSENLEAILELNPDLIVTGSAQNYEAYAKIAPTVFIENLTDVREQVKQLGHILGKEAQAENWLATFEERLAEAKARIGAIVQPGETVSVFDGGILKEITLYGNAYTGRTFHGELGLPMNDNVARDIDPNIGWLSISSELVSEYAGDHIFMAVNMESESFDYANDPIWGTLEAVKKNQLYEIDGYRFYFSDPISVLGQIEDTVTLMEARAAQ